MKQLTFVLLLFSLSVSAQKDTITHFHISLYYNAVFFEPGVSLHYRIKNRVEIYAGSGYALKGITLRGNGDSGGDYKFQDFKGGISRIGINWNSAHNRNVFAGFGLAYEFHHYFIDRYCWSDGKNGYSDAHRQLRDEINWTHAGMAVYSIEVSASKNFSLSFYLGPGIEFRHQRITVIADGNSCDDYVGTMYWPYSGIRQHDDKIGLTFKAGMMIRFNTKEK